MVRKMVESGDEGGGGRNFFDYPNILFCNNNHHTYYD